MFQALGHTLPALVASFCRIVLVAIPAFILSRMPGFHLNWIWYLSIAALIVQLVINLLLLKRELRLRLQFAPACRDDLEIGSTGFSDLKMPVADEIRDQNYAADLECEQQPAVDLHDRQD